MIEYPRNFEQAFVDFYRGSKLYGTRETKSSRRRLTSRECVIEKICLTTHLYRMAISSQEERAELTTTVIQASVRDEYGYLWEPQGSVA